MSGRGKLNSQQCKSVSARWLAARLQPCRRLNHAIVPCCSKITISLGHLLRHLICFWWPCGDVAIHMGYWISLCPAHSHSFCYVFFSSLSLSLLLTNAHSQPVQLANRDSFDWAIHVCWFKRLLRWLVILMGLLFSRKTFWTLSLR